MKPIAFISDLHLGPDTPELQAVFLRFLKTLSPKKHQSLYILGDLFNAWLGDDEPAHWAQEIQHALRQVTDSGLPVFFQAGNRDFLVGQDFAQATGVQRLADHCVLELPHLSVLLMHGDLLCTQDRGYQRLRTILQHPRTKKLLLALPYRCRAWVAGLLRQQSSSQTGRKSEAIMDVTPEAVEQVLQEHGANLLIHGHTHRPKHHEWTLNHQTVHRFVLADWRDTGFVAWLNAQGELHQDVLR